MKHILAPILFLVLLFPALALSEEVTGNFTCKIKDITILTMEEGLPKTYKLFEGGSTIGGEMYFEYVYRPSGIFFFDRTNFDRERLTHIEGFSAYDTMRPSKEDEKEYFPGSYFGEDNEVILSSDNLYFDGLVGKQLNLERYYKNDWQGLMIIPETIQISVYSLDCRHTVDSLDEILKDLRQKEY